MDKEERIKRNSQIIPDIIETAEQNNLSSNINKSMVNLRTSSDIQSTHRNKRSFSFGTKIPLNTIQQKFSRYSQFDKSNLTNPNDRSSQIEEYEMSDMLSNETKSERTHSFSQYNDSLTAKSESEIDDMSVASLSPSSNQNYAFNYENIESLEKEQGKESRKPKTYIVKFSVNQLRIFYLLPLTATLIILIGHLFYREYMLYVYSNILLCILCGVFNYYAWNTKDHDNLFIYIWSLYMGVNFNILIFQFYYHFIFGLDSRRTLIY